MTGEKVFPETLSPGDVLTSDYLNNLGNQSFASPTNDKYISSGSTVSLGIYQEDGYFAYSELLNRDTGTLEQHFNLIGYDVANMTHKARCTLQTEEPTSAIYRPSGVHFVILDHEPTQKYNGYIYLIKE